MSKTKTVQPELNVKFVAPELVATKPPSFVELNKTAALVLPVSDPIVMNKARTLADFVVLFMLVNLERKDFQRPVCFGTTKKIASVDTKNFLRVSGKLIERWLVDQ